MSYNILGNPFYQRKVKKLRKGEVHIMKIGFFDSGVGGLSVMHLALRRLPDEQFIFYADEEHVPYGQKTIEQITGYVDDAIRFMIEKEAKVIVIACNTATSAAIHEVRKKYSIPIIGMEPAVKKSLTICENQRVLVAATPVTIKGEKLRYLIQNTKQGHLVDLVAIPELVSFAEQGEFESEQLINLLRDRLGAFKLDEYSSIVLGCTHFNYFKDTFRQILPNHIKFVDGNEGTMNQLINELSHINGFEKNQQTIEYYFSGKKVTDSKELSRINECLKRLDQMIKII